MSCHNPTAQGFRALREEPAVFLAEIAWRWIFGACAIAFVFWGVLVFLDAVTVSRANLFLLKTLNPDAMSYALQSIFAGKGPLLIKLLVVAGPCLSGLWVITATVGRISTVRVLLERSAHVHGTPFSFRVRASSVVSIHILRALVMWAGMLAYVGCSFLAVWAAGGTSNFNPGVFMLAFLAFFGGCVVALSFVHWWIGLAPIFALRDGLGAMASIRRAASLMRRHGGQLAGLNLWHGLFRAAWVVTITIAGSIPFAVLTFLPGRGLLMVGAIAMLVYFAGADFLFAARYAGYVEIAEQERLQSLLRPPLVLQQPSV